MCQSTIGKNQIHPRNSDCQSQRVEVWMPLHCQKSYPNYLSVVVKKPSKNMTQTRSLVFFWWSPLFGGWNPLSFQLSNERTMTNFRRWIPRSTSEKKSDWLQSPPQRICNGKRCFSSTQLFLNTHTISDKNHAMFDDHWKNYTTHTYKKKHLKK